MKLSSLVAYERYYNIGEIGTNRYVQLVWYWKLVRSTYMDSSGIGCALVVNLLAFNSNSPTIWVRILPNQQKNEKNSGLGSL